MKGENNMKPKFIKKDELIVVGQRGSSYETGAIWQKFLDLYDKFGIFEQISKNELYKVRLINGKKFDVHFGMLTANKRQSPFYKMLNIPAFEYAVFEVALAKGYDEQIVEIEEWIKNDEKYEQGRIEGTRFLIEHYGVKYKEDDFDNSVIEIMMPIVEKED